MTDFSRSGVQLLNQWGNAFFHFAWIMLIQVGVLVVACAKTKPRPGTLEKPVHSHRLVRLPPTCGEGWEGGTFAAARLTPSPVLTPS
jgi:hypothetical protein